MPEHNATPRAVFLSYAREDSDAVRRIADALRAFGVEVWFDQNELRGGDSWDAKIRTQIRTCALCLPVVSAATQARGEGYFRREWKIAVERTHDMAHGVPFLMPVVIDDTAEVDALVPEEFMRVQWTRLPHGVPTPPFVEQVKRLLDTPGHVVGRDRLIPPQPIEGGRSRPAQSAQAGSGDPALQQSGKSVPGWSWGAVVAIAVGISTAIYVSRKSGAGPSVAAKPPVEAATTAPATPALAAPVVAKVNDKSIAVLPFENMSEEKDASAFFADGVHEDILTNLSFIRDLHVVSRTSVAQYRNTTKSIRQIAQELGVAYILEGSVRRAGNKVRVTGQLIRAETDEHVWAKAYDRDISDVFAIQAELAQSIAASLQAAISPAEKTLVERKPTDNPAAYALYVKARAGYVGNNTNFDTMEKDLVDAVQLDPGFAAAWAQLAAIHAGRRFNELDSSPALLAKAKAAIETAVRLAPDDPAVIEMQGDYYYYAYRDYERAAQQYQRLLALRPNSPEAYGSLGLIYRRQGHWAQAVANLRKAIELDPRNNRYGGALAGHLANLRHYEEATTEVKRLLAYYPDDLTWNYLAISVPAYFERGSTREVDDWFEHLKPSPDDPGATLDLRRQWARLHGNFAEAVRIDTALPFYANGGTPRWQQDFNVATDYWASGNMAEGRARLEKLLPELNVQLERQPTNSVVWTAWGAVSAGLGRQEDALRAAEKLSQLLPETVDAVNGPQQSRARGQILAWAGKKDEALAELARLLQVPYGAAPPVDRFDVGWLPLHGDPRFEALMNDPKNNAPMN